MQTTHYCPLCTPDAERVLWQDARLRVIRVPDPDYAGYLRVIWSQHVPEMSDLAPAEREHLMQVLMAVEACLRELMRPDKINLASFGNMVPHLHWHVIARFRDDRHFPQPIWGPAQRDSHPVGPDTPSDQALSDGLRRALTGLPQREWSAS